MSRIRMLKPVLPVLLLGWIPAGCDRPAEEPVVIGVIASSNFLNAARLAIADELAEGPIPGLDTLLIAEGTNLAEPALRAAEELAERRGATAVIGHSNSAASIAASQVYNRHSIVQVAPTSTAPLYRDTGPFSFRMVAGDEEQGRFLADALADSFPEGARLALLYVNDDYGRGLHRSLLEAIRNRPLRVALELPHTEGELYEPDVGHLEAALGGTSPDAVVWLGRTHTLDLALPGIRRALGEVPVYGSDGTSTAHTYSEGGLVPEWAGVRFVDLLSEDASPGLEDFRRRFLERFDAGATASEALTYDAVRLVLHAVRNGARDGETLRRHLEELGGARPAWEGVTGPVEFSDRGDGVPRYHLRMIPPDPAP